MEELDVVNQEGYVTKSRSVDRRQAIALQLLRSLLFQVNVRPGRGISENKHLVTDVMMDMRQKGTGSLVTIDEGQELLAPMLSELRFVLNFRTGSFSPLMAILSGQHRLAETLRLQVLECIRQRISVHYRLPFLAEDEISGYT